MQTIAMIGQKGGTGKTTLVGILAVAAELAGQITAVIDLDPQVSVCKWGDRRTSDGPIIVDSQPARLNHALATARHQGVDLVVIDTAGRAEQATLAATKAADLVIMPYQPTIADLDTLEGTLDIIRLAGSPPHLAVLTRIKPQGHRHEETAAWLEREGVSVCPIMLGDRITYQDAYAVGLTPMEFEPKSKAAEECRQLHEFIRRLMEQPTDVGSNEQRQTGDQRCDGERRWEPQRGDDEPVAAGASRS